MVNKLYSLTQIAEHVQGRVVGDPDRTIKGLAPLDSATDQHLSFHNGAAYNKQLAQSKAAVMLSESFLPLCQTDAIVCDLPYLAFAKAAHLFKPELHFTPGIDPTAVVHSTAIVPKSCSIGARVVIEADVKLGENCIVYPGSYIGERTELGHQCKLMANVSVMHDCLIADQVLIQSGAVVGAEGFGHAQDADRSWVLIPQLGKVRIGRRAEIGANTTIDRGALDDTVIGEGVVIDNMVQIAHNVEIGDHTAIAACVGIAGSVKIGKYCQIAGQVGIAGHLSITDNVILLARCAVTRSIKKPGLYSGSIGCQERSVWNRNAARFRQLDKIIAKIHQKEEA